MTLATAAIMQAFEQQAQAPQRVSQPLSATAPRVYFFAQGEADGSSADRALLGGKGADLAEMCRIGLAVPPGFTITTDSCAAYFAAGERFPDGLDEQVRAMVRRLERLTGKRLGSGAAPLLLSVRSGAAVSMPGMMDTVLNLGLNDEVVKTLAGTPGLERFAYDVYRRLIDMFGNVVMGVPHAEFEREFDVVKARYQVASDGDVPAAGLAELCTAYQAVYRRHVGSDFPMDPEEQLLRAIEAVFRSWNKPSAQSYRRIHAIEGLRGTAVNVQAMVFGNLGPDSGTGVGFTRNPATGEDRLYGEFLVDAQGEDVVAGIRTPRPIAELVAWNPDVARELEITRMDLEHHFGDMQDFEFTVERGKLWILQTRRGKRSGAAAVRIAVDMVRERLIDENAALCRVTSGDLAQLLVPSFDPDAPRDVLTKGLAASPGAASGKLAFTAGDAVRRARAGEQVLLVRRETSADDVEGMHHAAGILTATGGMTSHAAVVARGWGKCCVAGAGALSIDEEGETLAIGDRTFGADDILSIDGFTGEVMLGEVPKRPPSGVSGAVAELLSWADARARLAVHANADTPTDARRARDLGARGIGLCRTEHMFFSGDRIATMRAMILAQTEGERRAALDKLLPHQRQDFTGIFEAMDGYAVTIRLLDPPLHEFLPSDVPTIEALARDLGVTAEAVALRVDALRESNPMLGHRGCRLAVSFPEILEMQVTAIVEAAISCRRAGVRAQPEIMIPLVGTRRELAVLRQRVEAVIASVMEREHATPFAIPIGTMIEVPRAALVADDIAREAEFFSFGTNDLTQMTFGFSRDDAGSFLPRYLEQGILPRDPFVTIDTEGVGELVRLAVELGRATRGSLGLGVCGEHGGDPDSIRFFHDVGLDYVSCSPLRVPVARLVAGQAALAK